MSDEIAKRDDAQVGALAVPVSTDSLIGLVQMAVDRGASPESLGQLMALWEHMQRIEAEHAFNAAFAALQGELPDIKKDVKVKYSTARGQVEYYYASLGGIWRTIKDVMKKHGFSVRFEPHFSSEGRGLIGMRCVITHVGGHSASAIVKAPADTSGAKNDIQAIGSTLKYLQRYALVAALGLCTTDDDMDGVQIERDLGGVRQSAPPSPKPAWKSEQGELKRGRVTFMQDEADWWTWHEGKVYTLGQCMNAPEEERERLRQALKGSTWWKVVSIEFGDGNSDQFVTRSNPKSKEHPWGAGTLVSFRDIGERQVRMRTGNVKAWREIRQVRPVKENE